jgi:alkylation response protein AidB-like acyl-CoA dehydrogenase
MTEDPPLAVMSRMARGARSYDGADEVHQMVGARRILRSFEDGGVWRFT